MDEKISQLTNLTTADLADLYAIVDVSANETKNITEEDLEVTIANSTNFVDELVQNTYFTTSLANDSNFITELTSNSNFQTEVNNFVSGGGGGGGGGGTKLVIDTTPTTVTGTTAETPIFTETIPGRTLGSNNGIRFSVFLSSNSGVTGDITVRAYYGGSLLASITRVIDNNPQSEFYWGELVADNADNAQKSQCGFIVDANNDGEKTTYGTAAVDSTIDQDLEITVQTSDGSQEITGQVIIVEEIAGSPALTSFIPSPIQPIDGTIPSLPLDDNTVMGLGLVNIPASIEVTDITVHIINFIAAGTFSIALYSEDGATILIDETSGSVSGNGVFTHTLSSPIKLRAGNYYLAIHGNGSADYDIYCMNASLSFDITGLLPTGGAVYSGTLAITASTTPSTIDPTAITSDEFIPLMRFDS